MVNLRFNPSNEFERYHSQIPTILRSKKRIEENKYYLEKVLYRLLDLEDKIPEKYIPSCKNLQQKIAVKLEVF